MKTLLVKLDGKVDFKVLEDTQYVLVFEDLSGKKDHEISLIFEKEGVRGEIVALFKLGDGEKVNLATIAHHKVPYTSCHTAVKAVLGEDSGCNYRGKIIIDAKAQQTTSFLENNALITGENVKNTSEPILEIEADDVKASHGATTGRVDPEQVYYLQSRGLSKKESEQVIIEGFLKALLNTIKDEKIREQVKKALVC